MTTLADKAIILGADNRPPMLEKDMYDSWKSIMELYMMNRQQERMILESVENGPLIRPTIEENGVTRPIKYSELSPTDAIQADFRDLHTTNIDQLHAYLGQYEFHANEVRLMHERNSDPLALVSQQYSTNQPSTPLSITYPSNDYQSSVHHNVYSPQPSIPQLEYAPTVNQQPQQPEFPQLDSGLTVPVFKQGDDPIDAINHMMSFLSAVVTSRYPTTNNQLRNSTYTPGASGSNSGKQRTVICYNCKGEGHMSKQCTKPKRKRDDSWFKDKVLLNSMNSSDPSPTYRPTKFEVPKELLKVSMEIFQRDNSVSNQSAPNFNQYFELNELKAQSQEKDTVIRKLKERIKSLSGNMNEDKVKKDIEEIEMINIKLNHRVSKLIAENEHLKQTYNLQEKGLVITALKDELKKLKGKDLADNIVTKQTIALKMLKFDVEPIAPKLLNNKTAHSDYLRHTQEQATILREVVKQGKSQNPLNTSLDFACKYTKRIQELLIIIRQTCPSINNSSDKLVAMTPKNKDKRVRFTKPVTSSRDTNTNTKIASSSNLVSNKPMLSSTGVKPSTSASGSHPSGNTKKDKIQQTPSSTQKNKHSKLNADSELLCVKWNGCMFFDNHDLCVLNFINDRPTGRTFTIVENACPLTRITTTAEVTLRKPTALETDTPTPVVTLVYSRKPRKSKTNVPVSKPKIIKSISSNNKEPSKSWGSIVSDVPSSSLDEYRSSKLFSAIHGLVRGLPKLKFEKDHLCSACAMGKSKKKPYKPKSEDTNQEKLYLLRTGNLCGPKRAQVLMERSTSSFQDASTLRLKAPVDESEQIMETEFYKLPDISFFSVFGALCYPTNDSENLGKLQPKADIDFDELAAMASEHSSLEPALHEMTPPTISSGLVPNTPPSTSYVPPSRTDWDILFQPLFDELLNPLPSIDSNQAP
ncbi:retrovirus-related pol polyprotein from transposon TNT 1-94 [Tanacetum coccineum]